MYTDGTVEYYDLNENNDIVNNQTYYFSYDEVCRINQPFLKRTRIEFFGDTVPSIPINTDLAFEITCYSEEGLPIIVFDTLKSIEELNALEQLTKSPIISNDILNINLSDIKNTKYENAVSFLVRKNVVSGFDDSVKLHICNKFTICLHCLVLVSDIRCNSATFSWIAIRVQLTNSDNIIVREAIVKDCIIKRFQNNFAITVKQSHCIVKSINKWN